MHLGVHDWLVYSGEMVIYAFLKRIKFDNQITCDFKIKTK